jgi:hypothetical protein
VLTVTGLSLDFPNIAAGLRETSYEPFTRPLKLLGIN